MAGMNIVGRHRKGPRGCALGVVLLPLETPIAISNDAGLLPKSKGWQCSDGRTLSTPPHL